MYVTRRFESLDSWELRRLLKLVFEVSSHAKDMDPAGIGSVWGTIAADVGFELWLRQRADAGKSLRACGRSAADTEVLAGGLAH